MKNSSIQENDENSGRTSAARIKVESNFGVVESNGTQWPGVLCLQFETPDDVSSELTNSGCLMTSEAEFSVKHPKSVEAGQGVMPAVRAEA
jgi:hypothetical protein